MFVIGCLVLVYLALLVLITLISIRPYRIPLWISPGSLGDPQEEIEFAASDGIKIRGWWCENPNSNRVAVLFHGYMMNRSELVPEAHFLYGHGFSCLLVDFRAHGRSQSAPSSVGYRERKDVEAAVRFARAKVLDAKILLVGSSMGSAALAFALADDPSLADAAVIDSGYGRLDLAIAGWWRFLGGRFLAAFLSPLPLLSWPLNRINPYSINLSDALVKIGPKPLLFLHGTSDTLALPTEVLRNHASAVGPKRLVWFEGCNHSEGRWLYPEKYRAELMGWLEEVFPGMR